MIPIFRLKTFNIYWVLSTLLLVWFLLIHSPIYLYKRMKVSDDTYDIPFIIHLLGSYTICFSCICNSLCTPSINRTYHIWIGRIGMIGGIVGFTFGFYCSWYPYRRGPLPPRSFAIPITIGGCLQLYLQYNGYRSIRRYQLITKQIEEVLQNDNYRQHHINDTDNTVSNANDNNSSSNNNCSNQILTPLSTSSRPLIDRYIILNDDHPESILLNRYRDEQQKELENHITSMILLFVMACGIPAFIRLMDVVMPNSGFIMMILSILLLQTFANYYVHHFMESIINVNSHTNTTTTLSTPITATNITTYDVTITTPTTSTASATTPTTTKVS